jgi:hypothetical protein
VEEEFAWASRPDAWTMTQVVGHAEGSRMSRDWMRLVRDFGHGWERHRRSFAYSDTRTIRGREGFVVHVNSALV